MEFSDDEGDGRVPYENMMKTETLSEWNGMVGGGGQTGSILQTLTNGRLYRRQALQVDKSRYK